MRSIFVAVILLAFHVAMVHAADLPAVLVYTHNGPTLDGKKPYVHDNIPSAVKALEKLGADNGFTVTASDDPAIFTAGPLNKYRAIIFASSNNKAFDTDEQKKAFQDYIHGGGGFVGIHSATGSERAWPWYWKLIGGTFWFHAPLQHFTINVVDKTHPATACFTDDTWKWEDEFYVVREQPKDLHILLAGNIKLLKMPATERAIAAKLPDSVPLAWYHEFEGGRSFYTAAGPQKRILFRCPIPQTPAGRHQVGHEDG